MSVVVVVEVVVTVLSAIKQCGGLPCILVIMAHHSPSLIKDNKHVLTLSREWTVKPTRHFALFQAKLMALMSIKSLKTERKTQSHVESVV